MHSPIRITVKDKFLTSPTVAFGQMADLLPEKASFFTAKLFRVPMFDDACIFGEPLR